MDKQAEAATKLQNTLFDEVYLPRFKQACAQLKVAFETDEDLVAGLETAAMLKAAEQELREQGVDTRPSFQKQARDMLWGALNQGTSEQPATAENVKRAFAEALAAGTKQNEEDTNE